MKVQIVLFYVISAVHAQCDVDVPCTCTDLSYIGFPGDYTVDQGGETCSPYYKCSAPDAYLTMTWTADTKPTNALGTFFPVAPNNTATPFDMVSYFGITCVDGAWVATKFPGSIYYETLVGSTTYMNKYTGNLPTPWPIVLVDCDSFSNVYSQDIFV